MVLLVLLPLRGWLAADPTPPEPPPTEAPTEDPTELAEAETTEETAPEAPTPSEEERAADVPDASVAAAPPSTARRGRTRATAAGLDPNPYRR